MRNKRAATGALKVSSTDFFQGLATAVIFSLIIYLEALGFRSLLLNSAIALFAFYRLFTATQGSLLIAGFFIGVLWYYWVPFSFRFYDITWLIPFAVIGFGLGFAFIFWIIGFISNALLRMPFIYLLSYYEPFNFTWFKPEVLFVHTYFDIQKWQFALILLAIALFVYIKDKDYRLLPLGLLIAAFPFAKIEPHPIPFSLTLGETKINQSQKWQPQFRQKMVDLNMKIILKAIDEKKELVILPESNFPLYINMFPALVQQLKMLSYRIVIVTGGLYADGDDPYNATYHFEDGKLTIAKKMVLVPFGEYIPLPGFLRDWMSDVFFNGAQEYKTADRPTDFMIKDIKVRNAICYEGTCEAFYEDGTKYLIVTSNNSWFTPSIEPVLQSLLMTLYAKRHHVTVLHSANQSKSEIINY